MLFLLVVSLGTSHFWDARVWGAHKCLILMSCVSVICTLVFGVKSIIMAAIFKGGRSEG